MALRRNRPSKSLLPTDADSLRFVIFVPVWGSRFVDLFLRFCLRSLTTDGNIRAFDPSKISFCIISRSADFEILRSNEEYRRLSHICELREITTDGIIDTTVHPPHIPMSLCYSLGLESVDEADFVAIMLTPDAFVSNNTLRSIRRKISDGFLIVQCCGLRLRIETAAPLLEEIPRFEIEDIDLCKLALANLHRISLSFDVRSPDFNTGYPAQLYWIADDKSWLVAHCFHLHPLAVRLTSTRGKIGNSIDGDWLNSLNIPREQIFTASSASGIIVFELSPPERWVGKATTGFAFSKVERFAIWCANSHHRWNMSQRIVFNEHAIPMEVFHGIDATVKQIIENERGYLHYRVMTTDLVKRIKRRVKRLVEGPNEGESI